MSAQQKINAGGGVLYRMDEDEIWVLLIKRRNVWDLPKGKQEEGEIIADCAAREVCEEVGISAVSISAELGITEHEYDEGDLHIKKTTYWYSMQTEDDLFVPQTEEEITEIGWFPLHDALFLVGFDNLRTVLERFYKTFQN